MNEGTLALGLVLAAIGVGIFAAHYRDLIFTNSQERGGRAPALGRSTRRPARSVVRSRPLRPRRPAFKDRSGVQAALNAPGSRSAQQDAEGPGVQRSAFSEQRSAEQQVDRPASMDELRALGEALRLKLSGEARTKQAAIERAFKITKGGGDDWKRASYLYDQAMTTGRAREVETA